MGRAGRLSDAPRPLKRYEAIIMGMHQLPLPALHGNPSLITLDRARLEELIATAIDLLDQFDGDPDLENYDTDEEDSDPDYCLAGDDGCGPLLRAGRVVWGSEHEHDGGL
jgi:hypothetical protein